MPTYDPSTDAAMAAIDRRHVALRGSLALKYFPPDKWCGAKCRWQDNDGGAPHLCGLGKEHGGACEWSSECGAMAKGATTNDNT